MRWVGYVTTVDIQTKVKALPAGGYEGGASNVLHIVHRASWFADRSRVLQEYVRVGSPTPERHERDDAAARIRLRVVAGAKRAGSSGCDGSRWRWRRRWR
jgi:hypothetical protein